MAEPPTCQSSSKIVAMERCRIRSTVAFAGPSLGGLIGANRRLPSTRWLAADQRVSRNTVLLALEQLRAEGYVVMRPGSGMFIAPSCLSSRLLPRSLSRTDRISTHARFCSPMFSVLSNQAPMKPARFNPRITVGTLRMAFQRIPVL